MQRPDWGKIREEAQKLYRHPYARYWGLAAAGVILIVLILALLLSTQDTTPLDEFLATEWKLAMESGDVDAYTALWDREAEGFAEDVDNARKVITRQGVRVLLEGIQPTPDPSEPDVMLVQEIPVTFERDGEMVTTHHTLRLARRGWRRHWRILSHQIAFPQPPPAPVTQAPPAPTKPSPPAEAAIPLPAAGQAPLDTMLKLSQIVEAWRQAWEQKDLDAYLSWYAKDADITRVMVIKGKEYPRKLRKHQFRRHMERLNRKYRKIQVKVSNLRIDGDEAVADVNFLQEYSAWTKASGAKTAYHDLGTKRLRFMLDPQAGNWRIYQETWKIYREVPYKL